VSRTALEEAKAAWARAYAGLTQEEIDQRVMGFGALVRGIAVAGAVTPEEFGRSTSLSTTQASELFSSLAAFGLERDEAERIVGAALTTRRTPHAIRIAGKPLFAWCALDTLFIPGLLGEVGVVESTCPVSQAPVRLTVTPGGVETVDPPGAVLSVVLPAISSSSASTGPASPT
jgi:alkylmercury lyase